jgi:hypothetical protein
LAFSQHVEKTTADTFVGLVDPRIRAAGIPPAGNRRTIAMPIGSTTTARRLKARIARLDARVAQLRAMEASAMPARDFDVEDRLRGRIFDMGDRLARDVVVYAKTATGAAGSIDQVEVRALALFAAAPAARAWLYR